VPQEGTADKEKPPGENHHSNLNNNSNLCKQRSFLAPSNNGHKKDLLVYIFNVVEDEWPFIESLADPQKQKEAIEESQNANSCYFLSTAIENSFIYISPKKIFPQFQTYAQKLMNYKEGEILVPRAKTNLICQDLIFDQKIFSHLVKKAKDYRRLVLISYAASPYFYELQKALTENGIEVYAPEAPEIECAWTVNFFGSKSGIRQLAQKSQVQEPDFIMPEGLICVGRLDAAKIAAHKYIKQGGVVIKTNKGNNGAGVLILRENELPRNYLACEEKIYQILKQENYWEKFPIVVEDLININYNRSSVFPNIEFKIHKNGHIEMLYYCTMKVTPKGVFYGVDINKDVLNERTAARIIDTGYFIAEQYANAGYRGHFDIDMIAAKNNHIYVCESNTRNTGGTDIYKISQKLIGKDFANNTYVLSRGYRLETQKPLSFEIIMNFIGPLLFSPQTKEGIVLNKATDLEKKKLTYTIYGKNKKRTYEIEDKMILLLEESSYQILY